MVLKSASALNCGSKNTVDLSDKVWYAVNSLRFNMQMITLNTGTTDLGSAGYSIASLSSAELSVILATMGLSRSRGVLFVVSRRSVNRLIQESSGAVADSDKARTTPTLAIV